MITIRPVIDDILFQFFSAESGGVHGVARERIQFVDVSLRHYLEIEGERVLVEDDRMLLNAAHEFEPEAAFARTMHADELILAIPGYLNAMVPAEPLVLRAQLRTVERLVAWVLARRLVNADELLRPLMEARDVIDSRRRKIHHPALRGR